MDIRIPILSILILFLKFMDTHIPIPSILFYIFYSNLIVLSYKDLTVSNNIEGGCPSRVKLNMNKFEHQF